MLKRFVCSGKWIYINAPSGCSIVSINDNVKYSIPSGFYALNRDEIQEYLSNNYLSFEYADGSDLNVFSSDFAINGILPLFSVGGGGDAAILQHISDLLDAYIVPQITKDLGTLAASFDGSEIVVTVPDDSVYFKGKVDSDIVFDYSNISFDSSGKCFDAPLLTFISYVSIMSIYAFRLDDGVSFTFPVIFKDSKGNIYDASVSSGVSSYSFLGGVAADASAKCSVNDSTLSFMGLSGVKPSNLLVGSIVGSDFVVSRNPDCPVKDGTSYFSYQNGSNGCTFTSGRTDLKCTFHISFDFQSN